MNRGKIQKKRGMIIIQTMVFAAVAVMIIGALAGWAATSIKASRAAFNSEQAFQSAEAGIDYYRWHLAHAPTDYKDGTGAPGPYVHLLKDRNDNIVGQFSLDIVAPLLGSTLVKINSTGTSELDSSFSRKITSSVAKPSIAKYSVAGNSAFRFGVGTEIFGPVHVNGGIRFDGLAHNIVTSGTTTYTDTDGDACTTTNSYGVHTCVNPDDPASPAALPLRPDVFAAGRLISQPIIDFSGFTTDLAILKANAISEGFWRDAAGGTAVGYHMVLKTNDTFDLYRINSWASRGNCNSASSESLSWSVGTQTLLGNYSFPANGIIFLEDNLVVNGQINGARLTIAAADLISPIINKNIIVNNDLKYTYKDGTDTIGLIGQGAVTVGLDSEDNLEIDAAIIAQNDRVGRSYYNVGNTGPCTLRIRDTISLYGMIASYGRYGFAYTGNPPTGYINRFITYDANLLYAPPPDFPLTSDQYSIISWQEVK